MGAGNVAIRRKLKRDSTSLGGDNLPNKKDMRARSHLNKQLGSTSPASMEGRNTPLPRSAAARAFGTKRKKRRQKKA